MHSGITCANGIHQDHGSSSDDTKKLALFFCKMRLGVNTLQSDMFGNNLLPSCQNVI